MDNVEPNRTESAIPAYAGYTVRSVERIAEEVTNKMLGKRYTFLRFLNTLEAEVGTDMTEEIWQDVQPEVERIWKLLH